VVIKDNYQNLRPLQFLDAGKGPDNSAEETRQ